MPTVNGNQRQQAIEYALEGYCGASLDEVYVVPGPYADGKQAVLVVQRSYLDPLLAALGGQKIQVSTITVDYLLLPPPSPSCWRVVAIDEDIMWRSSAVMGGRIEAGLWPFVLTQLHAKHELPGEMCWLQDDIIPPPPLPESLVTECAEVIEQRVSWLDTEQLASCLFQLNTGPYKLRLYQSSKRHMLKRLSIFAVTIGLIALLSQGLFTAFLQFKLQKEQAIFAKVMAPLGLARLSIDQVRQHLEQTIAVAQQAQKADDFTFLVSQLAHNITKSQRKLIHGLSYQAGKGLFISVSAASASSLFVKLASLPGYVATLMPKSSQHDAGVCGKFA